MRSASSPASISPARTRSPRTRSSRSSAPATSTFGSTFSLPLDLGNGATLGTDPIDEAISTQASQEVSAAVGKAQTSYQNAEATYDKLATVAPRDPNVQLELAQAAQQSGNVPEGDHGLRALPRARTGRPQCVDREAADRAAEGRADAGSVRLDSPPSGKTALILSARPGATNT